MKYNVNERLCYVESYESKDMLAFMKIIDRNSVKKVAFKQYISFNWLYICKKFNLTIVKLHTQSSKLYSLIRIIKFNKQKLLNTDSTIMQQNSQTSTLILQNASDFISLESINNEKWQIKVHYFCKTVNLFKDSLFLICIIAMLTRILLCIGSLGEVTKLKLIFDIRGCAMNICTTLTFASIVPFITIITSNCGLSLTSMITNAIKNDEFTTLQYMRINPIRNIIHPIIAGFVFCSPIVIICIMITQFITYALLWVACTSFGVWFLLEQTWMTFKCIWITRTIITSILLGFFIPMTCCFAGFANQNSLNSIADNTALAYRITIIGSYIIATICLFNIPV